MPADPFVVDYSLINSVRSGNVTPCPKPHNLCDVSPGIASTDIDIFDTHLLAGSPAINAGTPNGVPSMDFDNHARDGAPDIGAYEWR